MPDLKEIEGNNEFAPYTEFKDMRLICTGIRSSTTVSIRSSSESSSWTTPTTMVVIFLATIDRTSPVINYIDWAVPVSKPASYGRFLGVLGIPAKWTSGSTIVFAV